MCAGKERKPTILFQPVIVDGPFEKWGIDVTREINPNSSQLNKYILTAINYFTKWIVVIPLKQVNDN